jgi:uncharacterized protein YqjF (DUF2071 family)
VDPSLGQAMRALIGAGVETFAATAGRALENDALPPADHRPWPLPHEPWVMVQSWQNALFAHWRLPPAALARFVPPGVELETFDGAAWLGITAFVVAGARLRGAPAVPGLSTFAEVNVRTYVTADDKPGVLFLSLDAASVAAVLGARAWFRLPYFFAAGRAEWRGEWVRFASRRDHPGVPAAHFSARYRAAGGRRLPGGETLTRWLVERYCLYCGADRTLLRAEIHHAPWPIEAAEASIEANALGDALGVSLDGPPALLHFSRGVDAVIWPPRVVERPRRAAA